MPDSGASPSARRLGRLGTLPLSVLVRILSELSLRDLLSFSMTCKTFRYIDNPQVLQQILERFYAVIEDEESLLPHPPDVPSMQRQLLRCKQFQATFIRGTWKWSALETMEHGAFRNMALAPSGRWLLVAKSDFSISLFDTRSGVVFRTLSGHADTIRCIDIYGKLVVSVGDDGCAKIWQLPNGGLINTFYLHRARISACKVVDNDTMLTGSADCTIKVWNPSGKVLSTLRDNFPVTALDVGRSNRLIVSGNAGKNIHIWSMETGVQLCSLYGHEGAISCVRYDETLHRVMSAAYDKTVCVWDVKEEPARIHQLQLPAVPEALWGDDVFLVVGLRDGNIKICSQSASHDSIPTFERSLDNMHRKRVTGVSVVDDKVFSCSTDGTVVMSNFERPKESIPQQVKVTTKTMVAVSKFKKALLTAKRERGESESGPSSAQDETRICVPSAMEAGGLEREASTVSTSGRARAGSAGHRRQHSGGRGASVSGMRVSRPLLSLPMPVGAAASAPFLRKPGTKRTAEIITTLPLRILCRICAYLSPIDMINLSMTCRALNVLSHAEAWTVLINRYTGGSYPFGFNADRPTLAAQKARLKRMMHFEKTWIHGKRNHKVMASHGPDEVVHQLVAGNNYAVTCGDEGDIKLYDLVSAECIKTLSGHADSVRCAFIYKETLMSVSDDGSIALYKLPSGELINQFFISTGRVLCCVMSEKYLFTGGAGQRVDMWTRLGSFERALPHKGAVLAMAISADEHVIATSSGDRSVHAWRVIGDDSHMVLRGHTAPVCDVKFSANPDQVYSLSYDDTIRRWNWRTRQCVNVIDLQSVLPKGALADHPETLWADDVKMVVGMRGGAVHVMSVCDSGGQRTPRLERIITEHHHKKVTGVIAQGDMIVSASVDGSVVASKFESNHKVGFRTAAQEALAAERFKRALQQARKDQEQRHPPPRNTRARAVTYAENKGLMREPTMPSLPLSASSPAAEKRKFTREKTMPNMLSRSVSGAQPGAAGREGGEGSNAPPGGRPPLRPSQSTLALKTPEKNRSDGPSSSSHTPLNLMSPNDFRNKLFGDVSFVSSGTGGGSNGPASSRGIKRSVSSHGISQLAASVPHLPAIGDGQNTSVRTRANIVRGMHRRRPSEAEDVIEALHSPPPTRKRPSSHKGGSVAASPDPKSVHKSPPTSAGKSRGRSRVPKHVALDLQHLQRAHTETNLRHHIIEDPKVLKSMIQHIKAIAAPHHQRRNSRTMFPPAVPSPRGQPPRAPALSPPPDWRESPLKRHRHIRSVPTSPDASDDEKEGPGAKPVVSPVPSISTASLASGEMG